MSSITCLFVYSVPYTAVDYIQIQPEPGAQWVTIPDAPYFRMAPFGYRTRLDEYARHGMLEDAAMEEFATWMHRRYSQLHPDRPPLAGIRLVAVIVPTTTKIPVGHWQKPALDSFASHIPRIWYTKTFESVQAGYPH